ncbi:MAG: hypothetical protein K6G11_02875, partial [Lachnospiraceae bacterium]|nr:hypothetical protein [Lachnospiraceae bacterium]
TAAFALDLSSGVYRDALDENLSDKLSSYGYMQIYDTSNFGGYQFAQRKDETGSTIFYKIKGRAVLGVKKIYFNKKIKYAIFITFQGTNISNMVNDADNDTIINAPTDSAVYLMNRDKKLVSRQLHYKYDSRGINRGFGKIVDKFYDNSSNYRFLIDKKKVSLKDIFKDLGKEDSKYRLIVTGFGAGGTMADILVGEKLTGEAGYEKNVAAYTFGAAGCLSKDRAVSETNMEKVTNYPFYTNIFNFVNADDYTINLCGDGMMGQQVIFTPDLSFRRYYYDNNKYSGQLSTWWNRVDNAIKTDNIAHRYKVYKACLERFRITLARNYGYNSVTNNYWPHTAYLTTNCFRYFNGIVVADNGVLAKNGVKTQIRVKTIE